MPAQEKAFRRQKALLWPKVGSDNYGQPVVGPASEIKVRWEKDRTTVLDSDGNNIAVDAVVILAEDVEPGSIMWLGKLAHWLGSSPGSSSGSADDDAGLMEVVAFTKTPDIKGRHYAREAGLKRFKEGVPYQA